MKVTVFWLISFLGAARLQAALYALAGSPSSYYDVGYDHLLFQITPNQPLRLLRRIGLQGEGSRAVRPDYQSRMIVVEMPYLQPTRIELISMDQPGVPAFRRIEAAKLARAVWDPWSPQMAKMRQKAGMTTGSSANPRFFDSRILVRSGVSWLVMRFNSAEGRALLGFPLSLNVDTPEEPIPVAEWNQVRPAGKFGPLDLGAADYEYGQVRAGRLCHNTASGLCADIGITSPPGPSKTWIVAARNSEVVVAVEAEAPDPERRHTGDGSGPVFIQRVGAQTWTRLVVPGGASEFKLMGQWVIGTAASKGLNRPSPGQNERRNASAQARKPRKPNTEERFARQDVNFYPGILFLIDSTTGRQFTIRTNQGDSEILLVEGTTVYYRVNDEIRSVPIQGNTLGQSTLIAKDDDLRDAHWAFTDRK